jgi:hypothetical protein
MFRKVFCLVVGVLVLSMTGSASAELVARYTFDNVTVPDLAGGDDAGGLPSWFVPSDAPVPSGTTHAVNLNDNWAGDGSDKDAVTGTSNLAPGTGDWSLAGWFSTRDIDPIEGGLNSQYLYRDDSDNASVIAYQLRTDTAEQGTWLELFMRDENANWVYSANFGLGIQANTWYHQAITRSGGTVKLYFDGVELDPPMTNGVIGNVATGDGPPPSVAGNATGRSFNGLIDEVRVYNHALSPDEVRALVPEPATIALLGLGGLALLRRKRS